MQPTKYGLPLHVVHSYRFGRRPGKYVDKPLSVHACKLDSYEATKLGLSFSCLCLLCQESVVVLLNFRSHEKQIKHVTPVLDVL